MNIERILLFNQNCWEVEKLANENNTTKSICGYAVCGVCEYLS